MADKYFAVPQGKVYIALRSSRTTYFELTFDHIIFVKFGLFPIYAEQLHVL